MPGQHGLAVQDLRAGERGLGGAAHGRAHAAHTCHTCTDSDGRAQEGGAEEAEGGRANLPQEGECRPTVCRRRVEPYQTDCLSRRLCQSHGEIRPATRDKRFGSPACLHRPVLPRFEAADGRTGRERAPTPSRAGRGGETAGNGQKGNQHAKAGGGQGGGKDRHHGEGGFSFGQWENQGAGGGQPQLAKRNSRP